MTHAPHTDPGTQPLPQAPAGTTVQALLTPTGPATDGFINLGRLRVERGIYDDFKSAQTYLAKSPEAVNELYALVHGRTSIDVRSTHVGKDEFGARDGRATISWAPKGALLNTDGSSLTPAMGLLHEEGHATRWLADPEAYNKDSQPYAIGSSEARTWTTPEERRNITGLEHRVGATLHEGSRSDHHGQAYTSRGPTSIESDAAHRVAARIAELDSQGHPTPPVGTGVRAVVAYDHREHTGKFVDIGGGEVAQHVGRGTYMMYDVARDLHGVKPPEGISVDVNTRGAVTSKELAPEQSR